MNTWHVKFLSFNRATSFLLKGGLSKKRNTEEGFQRLNHCESRKQERRTKASPSPFSLWSAPVYVSRNPGSAEAAVVSRWREWKETAESISRRLSSLERHLCPTQLDSTIDRRSTADASFAFRLWPLSKRPTKIPVYRPGRNPFCGADAKRDTLPRLFCNANRSRYFIEDTFAGYSEQIN